jgi:enterochelin esterase-like enzyme
MEFSTTVTGVITAFASLFTAVALVVTALTAWVKAREVSRKVDEVHLIVNQQRTDMQRYERALKHALTAAGIEIPVDQSVNPPPPAA